MTAGPGVSLAKIELIIRSGGEPHLGGPRRSLTG